MIHQAVLAALAAKTLPNVPAGLGGTSNVWVVVFVNGVDRPRWWHRLFKPGFRHVLALGFDGRCWLQVDPLSNLVDVRSFADAELAVVMRLLHGAGGTAVAIERTILSRGVLRAPIYCVSVVKHLLGVRALAVTPWQLYRALLRRGGRPVDLGEW